MERTPKNFLCLSVCGVLIFQLIGCGTILHPQRKGQKDGRLDPAIVILDGIGLLFFLIPGVIAFAVDFSNGTIYLSKGISKSFQPNDVREVKFDKKYATYAAIERILKQETGRDITLLDKDMKTVKINALDEIEKIR